MFLHIFFMSEQKTPRFSYLHLYSVCHQYIILVEKYEEKTASYRHVVGKGKTLQTLRKGLRDS